MIKILLFSFLTNIFFYSYGHLFKIRNNSKNTNYHNTKSILGVIIISFIALTLNFFLPLEKNLNTFIFFAGLLFLLIKKKFNFSKNEFNYLILSSIVTSLLILYSNVNRPDAGLYHLPYTSILNENKLIIGLSNIHFRFGHVSIIQYLSAINNNWIFKDIGVVIPLASICSFFFIYFFYDVFLIIKKKKIDLSKIFSLFIIIFISFKINRYSSFGNDAIAHLAFFYLISYLINKEKPNLYFVLLLSVFIFLNKTTLILSLIFPLVIFFKYYNFKNFKLIYSLPSIFLIFWFLKNLLISGCFLYPFEMSCINNLSWTDINEVKLESISAEAWSKSWPDRVEKNITMLEFNKNFNWFSTWQNKHGIYIAKIIIPYFLIIFFLSKFFVTKNSTKNKLKINNHFSVRMCFLICIIGTLLFFVKFPLFRYGYSYLIISGILIIFFRIKFINKTKLIFISKHIFIMCIVILLSKQLIRYEDKYDKRNIWPNIYSFSNSQKPKFQKIEYDNEFSIYRSDKLCMYSRSPCTNYPLKDLKISKKMSYFLVKIK